MCVVTGYVRKLTTLPREREKPVAEAACEMLNSSTFQVSYPLLARRW